MKVGCKKQLEIIIDRSLTCRSAAIASASRTRIDTKKFGRERSSELVATPAAALWVELVFAWGRDVPVEVDVAGPAPTLRFTRALTPACISEEVSDVREQVNN
jgi:hypothetical protein